MHICESSYNHELRQYLPVAARPPSEVPDRRRIGTSLYSGLLFAVLGVIAWVSGQPFVFPSLGPSAFILSFER